MSEEFNIRLYEARDLDAVYRVCLETGDTGDDATHERAPVAQQSFRAVGFALA